MKEAYKDRIKQLKGIHKFVYSHQTSKWYSYDDFWHNVLIVSNQLNCKNSKTVIAVMDNGIKLFFLYFACMLTGTVIIPIDPYKAKKEINEIVLEHSGAVVFDDESIHIEANNDYSKKAENDIDCLIDEIDLDKIFMITYTSGSTGRAKGVIHTLRNLFGAAEVFGKATGLNAGYTMCHVMPMTYMAGILNTIMMPFICGCKIALLPRFDVMSAISFWKNVKKLQINAFWFSPTMLNLLMTVDRKARIREYLNGRETLFFVGTAPLHESTRRKFEEKYGVDLLQSYGLSETLFIATELPSYDNNHKAVGKVLPGVKIKVYPDQEIGIQVPWMFRGYSNEDTGAYFFDGNYMSGDLGILDEKNELILTGRKKDLIIKGGMNISPAQIENCLIDEGLVSECAALGIKKGDEESIVCWYVAVEDKPFLVNEANKYIELRISKYARVDRFVPVKQIPKNLNGKIDKQKLKEEF